MQYAIQDPPAAGRPDRNELESIPAAQEEDEGYAGLTLDIITAFQTGSTLETALNIPNAGAMPGMADDDIVEVSARVSGKEIHSLPIAAIPAHPAQLVQAVKLYENTAVEAILNRSRRLAIQALMCHPLVLSFTRASRLVDEYIRAHAAYAGEWS